MGRIGVPDVAAEFRDWSFEHAGRPPLAPADRAGGDRQAQQVEGQLTDRPLAHAIAAGQDAEDRPQPRPERPGGHARRQRRTGRSPTARAGQAMEPVLVDHRLDRRHFGDLMADRLGVVAVERLAAGPAHGGLALEDLTELIRRDQGPGLAAMSGLAASLLPRGGRRRPSLDRGRVGRRRLGRVGGVLVDPLFQDGDPPLEGLDQRRNGGLRFRRERVPKRLRERRPFHHVNVLLNSRPECNIGP